MILTPDQRLRVFVSSTLNELRDERAAVRTAIEKLRLIPVMLEPGARPHPPRTLYRSYIEQSHIFVGLYGSNYGWIDPDIGMSGPDDEYESSRSLTSLIYVKDVDSRDPRLEELLDKIRARGGVSYRTFSDADELSELVRDDLALTLTEAFELPSGGERSIAGEERDELPDLASTFFGRQAEIAELRRLLTDRECSLVTVLGPGGIGKTRLAIEAARDLTPVYPDGIRFVDLSSLTDPDLVMSTISSMLQVRTEPGGDAFDALAQRFHDSRMLLILDNFEQLLPAAPDLARLLQACPSMRMLVTSRAVLRVRGEHSFAVDPLPLPSTEDPLEMGATDSVRLLYDRAQSVRPDFHIDEQSAPVIAEMIRRLDGVPLAIELAAARLRILSPSSLLSRLRHSMEVLGGSFRDLPPRQQTLARTIAWSYDLLGPEEKILFARLGVFAGGFTLDAAEQVCGQPGDLDVLELLSSLMEQSLIRAAPSKHLEPRFVMLQTIRDFAAEQLAELPDRAETKDRHARWTLDLCTSILEGQQSNDQTRWLDRVAAERDNIRLAVDHLFSQGRLEDIANDIGWTLWYSYWASNQMAELRSWMSRVREGEDLSAPARAKAVAVEGAMALWQGDLQTAMACMHESLPVFEQEQDYMGVALCHIPLGLGHAYIGDTGEGISLLTNSVRLAKKSGNKWVTLVTLNSLCLGMTVTGKTEGAEAFIAEALELSEAVGSEVDCAAANINAGRFHAYKGETALCHAHLSVALELFKVSRPQLLTSWIFWTLAQTEAKGGDARRGAIQIGVAESLLEGKLFPVSQNDLTLHEGIMQTFRSSLGDEAYEAAVLEGRSLGFQRALESTLGQLQTA